MKLSPRTTLCAVLLMGLVMGCPGTTLRDTGDADAPPREADAGHDVQADAPSDVPVRPDIPDTAPDLPAPDVVDEVDTEVPTECAEANLLPDSLSGDLLLSVARSSDVLSPGFGYDTLGGELLQLCVGGGIATSAAQDVVFEFREIENRADLSDALSVGVDVSIGFLGWGFENHFRMARSREVSSYDLNVWVRVRVISGSEALVSDIAILPEFQTLLDEEPLEFLERCGDRYVHSVTFGGELIILMSIGTTSEDDRFELENEFSGFFGIFGSLGVDVESDFEESLAGRDVSFEVSRVGGGGALPAFSSPADVMAYASQFPAEVAAGPPVPFEFVTRPYDRIHDGEICLPGFDEKSIELISSAWDLLNEAIGVRNALAEAIDSPDAYACGSNQTRREDLERVEEFVQALEDSARDCAQAMSSSDDSVTTSECRTLEELIEAADLPAEPLRWQLVRTMEAPAFSRNHSIFLPETEVCELTSVAGLWSRWGNDTGCPAEECWASCPAGSISGGEFAISYPDDRMDDNRGVCTYSFGCFHREDAYLLEECRALECPHGECAGTCSEPLELTLGEPVTGETGGRDSGLSGSCAAESGGELVYALAPDATGTVCLSLTGEHNSVLHVRTECPSVSSETACSDDVDGVNSQLELSVEAGATYFVIADSFTDGGAFELSATPGACEP